MLCKTIFIHSFYGVVMKNFFCFLSLIIISFITITEFSYASVPDGINLTKTSSGYHVDFSLPSYQLVRVTAEGNEYLQLVIPDYGVTPEVGLPALPLISFNLFISYTETQPEFEIKNIATSEMILKNKIFPFQMPWEKSNPLDERPFTINNNYYNSLLVTTSLKPNISKQKRKEFQQHNPVYIQKGQIRTQICLIPGSADCILSEPAPYEVFHKKARGQATGARDQN